MEFTVLARVYSLVAAMEAVKAEIIAMQTANSERDLPAEAVEFNAGAFQEKAQELYGISSELQNLGH